MWNIIAVSHLVLPTPLSPTRTTFTTSCLDSMARGQDCCQHLRTAAESVSQLAGVTGVTNQRPVAATPTHPSQVGGTLLARRLSHSTRVVLSSYFIKSSLMT